MVEVEEFVLDTPVVRGFVVAVREQVARAASPEDAIDAIKPRFAALLAELADPDWLPQQDSVDGSVWRHAYDPASGAARPFRSGYANAPCDQPG